MATTQREAHKVADATATRATELGGLATERWPGEERLLDAVRKCWASLFTDRAVKARGNSRERVMQILCRVA